MLASKINAKLNQHKLANYHYNRNRGPATEAVQQSWQERFPCFRQALPSTSLDGPLTE